MSPKQRSISIYDLLCIHHFTNSNTSGPDTHVSLAHFDDIRARRLAGMD
jgi:hypothetical protein